MLRKYRIHKYHDYYLVAEPRHFERSLLCGPWYENRLSVLRSKELTKFLPKPSLLFFHKHNLISRWNVGSEIDQYHEALAMAYYYMSAGVNDNEIKLDDVGITISTSEYPLRLINYLRDKNFQITHPYAGIYYIYKDGIPDTQILVSKPLLQETRHKFNFPYISVKATSISS